MFNKKQFLLIEQADQKVKSFRAAAELPPSGWVYTIRTALNMSLRQLGIRLNITPQGAKLLEQREREGTITLNSLRDAARVMDMKLVYGFVPNQESIDTMIHNRAKQIARDIVLRTSQSMKLEDQQNSDRHISKMIDKRAEELIHENLKLLWD